MRARMLAAHGDVAAALEWARQYGVSADDEVSYLREYEHVTLARVLLAQHASRRVAEQALADAVGLLERLLAAAEEGGRQGTVIEVLALLALARQQAGDDDAGARRLGARAAPGRARGLRPGLRRRGQPMAALLERPGPAAPGLGVPAPAPGRSRAADAARTGARGAGPVNRAHRDGSSTR